MWSPTPQARSRAQSHTPRWRLTSLFTISLLALALTTNAHGASTKRGVRFAGTKQAPKYYPVKIPPSGTRDYEDIFGGAIGQGGSEPNHGWCVIECPKPENDTNQTSKPPAPDEYLPQPVSLYVDPTTPLFTVRDTYISYTIDTSDQMDFFTTDFNSSRLAGLAKLLSPAIARVGGSVSDRLVYQFGAQAGCIPSKYIKCLNGTHFLSLANFVRNAGAQMVFGLNVLYPSFLGKFSEEGTDQILIRLADGSNMPIQPGAIGWDPTNAFALLFFAIQNGVSFFGLELGNEQNRNFEAVDLVGRLRMLAGLLDQLYPAGQPVVNPAMQRPRLLGPDPHSYIFATSQWPGWMIDYVDAARDILFGVTYHEYVGVTSSFSSRKSDILDGAYRNGLQMAATVSLRAPELELWAGEIANANKGGADFGDTFGASLWYADSLGVKATLRHSVFARQALFGSRSYTLIGPGPTFIPRPSFYTAVFAKRLLGTRVLRLSKRSAATTLRSYAFCAKGHEMTGGVAVIVVNLQRNSTTYVNISVGDTQFTTVREEYHFTSTSFASKNIYLNGQQLMSKKSRVPGQEFNPDDFQPIRTGINLPLVVAPSAYTVVVLPDAQAPACRI